MDKKKYKMEINWNILTGPGFFSMSPLRNNIIYKSKNHTNTS